jgi:transcriptional regulator with XRE-family HTH domain
MSTLLLADYLRQQMNVLKLTNTDVARYANIARQTWHRLLKAEIADPKPETLLKIAAVLETSQLHLQALLREGRTRFSSTDVYKDSDKYVSGFIADINYPINSLVFAGETFTKKWRIANTTRQEWKGMYLQCLDREFPNPTADQYLLHPESLRIPLPDTPIGSATNLCVKFTAPVHPSRILSEWRITDRHGIAIESSERHLLRCLVRVVPTI